MVLRENKVVSVSEAESGRFLRSARFTRYSRNDIALPRRARRHTHPPPLSCRAARRNSWNITKHERALSRHLCMSIERVGQRDPSPARNDRIGDAQQSTRPEPFDSAKVYMKQGPRAKVAFAVKIACKGEGNVLR